MAQKFQKQLETGSVKNPTGLDRRHGISRARVTQIMNLLKLEPEIRGKYYLNFSSVEFDEDKRHQVRPANWRDSTLPQTLDNAPEAHKRSKFGKIDASEGQTILKMWHLECPRNIQNDSNSLFSLTKGSTWVYIETIGSPNR